MSAADNYAGASPLYCGMNPPVVGGGGSTPAWMSAAGVALNKLVAIPNSSMGGTPAAGCGIFAFSGLSVRRDTCELFSAANGGHSDSSDNGVYSFGPKGVGLMADNPSWILRCAPTALGSRVIDVPTQPDGKPTSRHSYDRNHYVGGSFKRIVMIGGTGLTGNAYDDVNTVHTYDVEADTWDATSSFVFANSGYSNAVDHVNNLIWTGMLRTYDPVTHVFSGPIQTNPDPQVRFPMVVANDLNVAFCLQFGNGFTTDPTNTLQASKTTLDTRVQTPVTFNPSAAFTQFMADAALANVVPGMDYDEANGVFYWYQGQAGQENHLYVIHPNAGNVWDMTLFPFASGSATMTTCANSGLCGRLKYLPALKGIVLFPSGGPLAFGSQPLFFLKTSV